MKNFLKSSLIICLLVCINSCSKSDTNDTDNFVDSYQQNPDIAENIILIEEERTQILSTDAELLNGIYNVEFSGSVPQIITNDIIIGEEGDGFIRKVISSTVNGNTVSIKTTQANMEDVFKNATIEFTTDISESSKTSNGKTSSISQYQGMTVNYLAKGVTLNGNGLDYDFSNTVLYQGGPLTFKITNGTATFDPNFSFKSEYSLFSLSYLDFKVDNANLAIDCDLLLNASAGVNLPTFSKTLADFDKKLRFLVGGLPVIVKINTKLVAELNAGIDASFDLTTGFTNNYTITTGVNYANDNWTGIFDYTSSLTPKPINMEGEVNIAQNFTITPKVSVMFYGVIGPYCEPAMTEDFAFNIASPFLDWDSNLKVGLDIKTGVKWDIFSFVKGDYTFPNANFEETIWSAPESLEIVSGNNQTAEQATQLSEPLKVKVTDVLDNPMSIVPVYFNVTSGNGTVDNQSVMTDENGFAEVIWTLGDNTETQTLDVTVKKADGTNIKNTPKTFNATATANVIGELIIGTWIYNGYYRIDDSPYRRFKIVFDSNGNSISTQIDENNGDGWVDHPWTYNLTYDGVDKLTLLNTYWNVADFFRINAVDQTLFNQYTDNPNDEFYSTLTR